MRLIKTNIRDILRNNIIYTYTVLALSIIGLDRLTKYWALIFCKSEYRITSFLSCILSYNRGISWGIFNSDSAITYIAITSLIVAIVIGLLIYIIYSFYTDNIYRYKLYGEIAVLAGSFSNLIDRFIHKGVIDFISIDIGWSQYAFTWPSFNIADSAIVIGVGIMFFYVISNDK